MPRKASKGSKKSAKVSGNRKIKKSKKSKKSKRSYKIKSKSSTNDLTTEEMRRIIFSTESDTQPKNDSYKSYTPTYNPNTQQIQTQPQQMAVAPQLSPSNFNPNLFQTMAPPMNYDNFHGNMNNLIPNYAQDFASSPIPNDITLPHTAVSPVQPLMGNTINPAINTNLNQMAPSMGVPVNMAQAPLSPVNMTQAPLSPVNMTQAPLSPVNMTQAPLSPVRPNTISNYGGIPDYA